MACMIKPNHWYRRFRRNLLNHAPDISVEHQVANHQHSLVLEPSIDCIDEAVACMARHVARIPEGSHSVGETGTLALCTGRFAGVAQSAALTLFPKRPETN